MSFERRKVRVGRVVSDKMDKTVVVLVEWRRPHRLYRKPVRRASRFKVHDEKNESRTGDVVKIIEARPHSKTKRWSLQDVLVREEIAEVLPAEIGVDESVAPTRQQRAAAAAEVKAAEKAVEEEPAVAVEEEAPVAEAEAPPVAEEEAPKPRRRRRTKAEADKAEAPTEAEEPEGGSRRAPCGRRRGGAGS